MFGYVTICKNAMTEGDYKIFRSYYCGLCKSMGRQCSQLSRLGLSYDITFLAIVLSALEKKEPQIREEHCAVHHMSRHSTVHNDPAVDYAANIGVLLTYLKLKDDWEDDRSIKALFGMILMRGAVRRAGARYKRQYGIIERELKRLSECERRGAELDEAADCFAKILEALFTPDFAEDLTTVRVLGWFGYNIGRWIYVMDAFADIEEDYESGGYNPLIKDYKGNIAEYKKNISGNMREALTLNLTELASTYELLEIHHNDSVIRHIIYLGLKEKQNKILGENNESI